MIKRNLVVVGLALLLSACGFQLRGTGDTNFALDEVNLQARNSYGETVQQLEELLKDSGVRVYPGARYTLDLVREQTRQRTASYTTAARTAEYELTQSLDYEIRGPQNTVLLEDQVEVSKVYVHDSSNLISSDQEASQLRRAISHRHSSTSCSRPRKRRSAPKPRRSRHRCASSLHNLCSRPSNCRCNEDRGAC